MSNSIRGLEDITSFKWGTITSTNPLAVRLDGDTAPLALIPDSLIDPMSLAPGARVRVELSLRKCVIHGAANGDVSAGEMRLTGRYSAPTGWLLCQGQSLSRTTYARLFAAIGTLYGAPTSTTFQVPDMRGRVAVGYDPSQTEFNVAGKTGGAKTHVLTAAEMPVHSHSYTAPGPVYDTNINAGSQSPRAAGGSAATTGERGANAAHNNLQPYLALNYIIKI